MSQFLRVDSTDIAAWADRRQAQSDLPRLVRRLIFATVDNDNLVSIAMPSGDSVQIGGWDGRVRTCGSSTFVPNGESGWEMSCARDVKAKANSDYDKRTTSPLEANPAETTFVFVTARKWPGKEEWVSEKKDTMEWHDVRAYDADDLEAWLECAPGVKNSFARELGKPVESLRSLEDFWLEWRKDTRPAMSHTLVLAGRDEAVNKLSDWLRNRPSSYLLRADTQEEAIVFLACVIESMPEDDRSHFLSRCLIVSDVKAWRQISHSRCPLVLIPKGFDARAHTAVMRKHHVLVPGTREAVGSGPIIDLPKLSSSVAADELHNMGLETGPAIDDARLARRSLQAFRRKYSVNVQFQRPAWSRPPDLQAIIAAFLAGSWDDSIPADAEIIGRLGGKNYLEIRHDLHSLAKSPDPPIRNNGSSWYLVSKEDSWLLLRCHIRPEFINRLATSCYSVLGKANPALALPVGQRLMANSLGYEREHSHLLRRGLADSLAFLGSRCLQEDTSPEAEYAHVVTQIVRKLLTAASKDHTGNLWTSLANVMPRLAESAPEQFLEAMHAELEGESPLLKSLFGGPQNGDAYFLPSPYTGVMWALETLTWSPDYIGWATQCLARFVDIDPGKQVADRFLESLKNIFMILHPQPSASLNQRLDGVLDMLMSQVPTTTWKLLLSLLPAGASVFNSIHRPMWREWRMETSPEITPDEWDHAVDGITNRIMGLAGNDIGKLVDALDACTRRVPTLWTRATERLLTLDTDAMVDDALADSCLRLRRKLLWITTTKGRLDPMQNKQAHSLTAVIEHLTPRSFSTRHAWLFGSSPPLPDPFGGQWNHDRYVRSLAAAREQAVKQVCSEGGCEQVRVLAAKVGDPEALGETISRLELFDDQQELDFLRHQFASSNKSDTQLGIGYIGARFHELGWSWAETLLSNEVGQWSDNSYVTFLLQLPRTFQTWNWAERRGPSVEAEYWSGHRLLWLPDSEHYLHAVKKMLEHGKPGLAVMMLGIMQADIGIDKQEQLVAEALDYAVTGHEKRHRKFDQTQFAGYVAGLLDYLDSSIGATNNIVARLEWAYSPLLDPQYRKSKRLVQLLTHDPVFFAEIISVINKPSNANSRYSAVAESVIRGWMNMPCHRETGWCDPEALRQWVEAAQEELTTRECRDCGDRLIGMLLNYGSDDSDGLWPHEGVRDILESVECATQELKTGFVAGFHAKRGTIVKASLEGGQQERDLAKKYSAYAQGLRDRWPVTAALLRQAAQSLNKQARREDQHSDLREDLGL